MKLSLLSLKAASAICSIPLPVQTGEKFFTTLVNDFLEEHQEPIIETLENMERMLDDFKKDGASVMQDARADSVKQLLDDSYKKFSVLATNQENEPKWRPHMSQQFVDDEWKWVKNADPVH